MNPPIEQSNLDPFQVWSRSYREPVETLQSYYPEPPPTTAIMSIARTIIITALR